jgi:hypothetical protein
MAYGQYTVGVRCPARPMVNGDNHPDLFFETSCSFIRWRFCQPRCIGFANWPSETGVILAKGARPLSISG